MKTTQRILLFGFIAVSSLVFVPSTVLYSQTVVHNLWGTNGIVYATAFSGNTIYIGGIFTYVSLPTGSFTTIDTSTGIADGSFPKVNGDVYAIAFDGSGGWFIGGDFTAVGGVARNRIAHIKSDKTVDLDWNPDATDRVRVLAVSGSTVYAGGDFMNIGGATRNGIAALDASSGVATTWNPDANSTVCALAISGSKVYAGGYFSHIGGLDRACIAALDTAPPGNATSWNPDPVGYVYALAVSGPTVYAGGAFSTIGGKSRHNIAALDSTPPGNATPWNPGPDAAVDVIAISGSTVYVGGAFGSFGGEWTRNCIAAIDSTSPGNLTSWNPNVTAIMEGGVYALAVSGSTVYAGGAFSAVGDSARNNIAAIDTTPPGKATGWNPNANSAVYALAISGAKVHAGGNFTTMGGAARNNIAALDASTGRATSWDPNPDGAVVLGLAVSGSTVYAGGGFMNIGGAPRNNIAALDASTGLATIWDPNADGDVGALAVSGSTVYAAGGFTFIGGADRYHIAALDASTGLATSWNPNSDGNVKALALSGSTVYAGGGFTNIGGAPRNNIAALDSSTGLATSWNPNSDGTVQALALSGSVVYAGGRFSNIGGSARNCIAAIDTSTGTATSWDPNVSGVVIPEVDALAVSGSTVYAGGGFTTIGDSSRNNIAAIDTTPPGKATGWNPNANSASGTAWINALTLDFTNARVYAGGDFADVLNSGRSYFVGLTNPADAALPVEMISCAASVTGRNVELRWTTATEVDNAGWEVERKEIVDLQLPIADWIKAGYVNGSGTNTSPHQYSFVDQDVSPGRYAYRLKQMDRSGTFQYWNEVRVEVGNVPLKFALHQNYPNPFNPTTTIEYALPEAGRVTLKVFDLLGREVATLVDEVQEEGYKSIQFESSGLSSGMYLYRLRAGDAVQTRKMVLMK